MTRTSDHREVYCFTVPKLVYLAHDSDRNLSSTSFIAESLLLSDSKYNEKGDCWQGTWSDVKITVHVAPSLLFDEEIFLDLVDFILQERRKTI